MLSHPHVTYEPKGSSWNMVRKTLLHTIQRNSHFTFLNLLSFTVTTRATGNC